MSRRILTWLVVIAGPTVVGSGVFSLLAVLSADEVGEDECHGIGWGCTLTDRGEVWLSAVVLAIVVVPLATLTAIGLTAAAQAPPGERARAAGSALLVAVGVIGLALVVGQWAL